MIVYPENRREIQHSALFISGWDEINIDFVEDFHQNVWQIENNFVILHAMEDVKLTYGFVYKGEHLQRLLNLCQISRCLYNQGLHEFRQALIKDPNHWLFYRDLEKIMRVTTNLEGEINFKLLKAQCAQQCLRRLDANIRSYSHSIKDWKEHKEKYKGMPKMPKYLRCKYREVVFTNQCSTIKGGFLWLYKDLRIPIPQWERFQGRLVRFQQATLIPLPNGTIKVLLSYRQMVEDKYVGDGIASIDLGVKNLATLVMNNGETVIYNGNPIKSINQWANKQIAKTKSELELANGRKTSKRIAQIWVKRNNRINDAMHKASRSIVNTLKESGIGTLAVGYNKGWKNGVSLGKKTNQVFVSIPYQRFIEMLRYKCKLEGIDFKKTEEGYTSKCDALALEKIGKHDDYLGKRKKRGLFQSSIGKLINADVNGSLNIMRKVFGDSPIQGIVDRGLLFNPVKCTIEKPLRFANKLYNF